MNTAPYHTYMLRHYWLGVTPTWADNAHFDNSLTRLEKQFEGDSKSDCGGLENGLRGTRKRIAGDTKTDCGYTKADCGDSKTDCG